MKKVSLFLGMVLAASFAMAQNVSNTLQNGDENSIAVTQTGTNNLVGRAADASYPALPSSQTGDENKATVTQDGSNNKAFFEQGYSLKYATGPFLGGGLYGTDGDKNEITISQTGSLNLAWGYSLGNLNIVSVTQAEGSNQAGHWLWGNGNHATQSQTGGIENYSYVSANSSNNTSVITQVGSQNTGTTSQGWIGYANHNGNEAAISQTGNRNKVELADGTEFSPALPGYTSDLYGEGIQQYGQENDANVTQDGDDNQAAIYQFGDENEGSINQLSDFNEANLIQIGNSNSAEITQEFGNYNIVNLKQDGEGGEATILQHGTGNKVKGLGIDLMATSFDGSTLDVEQWGTTNTLNLQQADGASATVYQNGTSNVATISQNQ